MFVSLRTQPIKKGDHARRVSGHNSRSDPRMSNGADDSRTHLNQHLVSTAPSIDLAIDGFLEKHKVKPPKNAQAVAQEIVLSASPEYFRPGTDRNDPDSFGKFDDEKLKAWQEHSLKWLQDRYKSTLVDVQLHLDERTPHIHAVVVPVVNKYQKKRRTNEQIANGEEPETVVKKKWNRSAYFDRSKCYEMQDSYAEALSDLGLSRGIPKKVTKKNYKTTNDFKRESNSGANTQKPAPKHRKGNTPSLNISSIFQAEKVFSG